jgi:hypothetical protein
MPLPSAAMWIKIAIHASDAKTQGYRGADELESSDIGQSAQSEE